MIVLTSIWVYLYMRKLKKSLFEKIIRKKIINKPDFSTSVAEQAAEWILKLSRKKRENILKEITENKIEEVILRITPEKLREKMSFVWKSKNSKSRIRDKENLLLEIRRLIRQQKFEKAESLLQTIKISSYEKTLKAQKDLVEAQIALKDGDMLSATQKASAALKCFQKKNWSYEEGEAYFVLGTAYRVSGVFDSADFMLRSAAQMFQYCGAVVKEAEVKGTQGLLMAVQQRFEEADAYYEQASEILKSQNFEEELNFIVSQKAMLKLLQKNDMQAVKLAKKALDGHKTNAGKALATDVLARAFYHAGFFKKAENYVNQAAEYYLEEKNDAAVFECFYLAAEIYVKRGWCRKAENCLRELIKRAVGCKTCFHIANAYTLLGLLLLERGAYSQAESIFNKALQQELYNNRCEGIAIDYANLAAVERKYGNMQAAQKNKKAALLYAKKADKVLYEKFKAILK